MRISHVKPSHWVDTDETGVIQPSEVGNLEHLVELFEEYPAGEVIPALRAVWVDPYGRVHLLDSHDAEHAPLYAGVSILAALPCDKVRVQRMGTFISQGLQLVPGPVWLGPDGTLTQTPPTDGIDLYIGAATADDRVILFSAEPITLE
jgi:hypothetical protein